MRFDYICKHAIYDNRATLYREGLKCQQKFAQSCLQEEELSAEIDNDIPSRLA